MQCRATRAPRPARLSRCRRIAEDRKGWLFCTAPRHNADALSDRAMNQYAACLRSGGGSGGRHRARDQDKLFQPSRPLTGEGTGPA